jgi:hypothetical protein
MSRMDSAAWGVTSSPSCAHLDAATRTEPAHREAFTTITKAQVAYPQILSAYDAVEAWVKSGDHVVTGSPREIYFADFDAAGPDDPVADIAFPVQ